MNHLQITELTALLEEEAALGEELRGNVDAQKQAIVCWDAAKLLESVDSRERALRLLAAMENRRRKLLEESVSSTVETVSLRRIVAELSQDDPARVAVSVLRERLRDIFTRLTAEEGALRKLMENLLSHIQDALLAFPETKGAVYDESGSSRMSDDRLGLYNSKA